MATVALSSTVNSAADGDTYVSSAQTYNTQCFLASDFDDTDVVRFEATSTGLIEVLDSDGQRIGIVPAESAAVAYLNASGNWRFFVLPAKAGALVADGSDAATTQTLANALKVILQNFGMMKAE
jgi:hypothetical protein